jgi:thiamine transport system substrate-binding protein
MEPRRVVGRGGRDASRRIFLEDGGPHMRRRTFSVALGAGAMMAGPVGRALAQPAGNTPLRVLTHSSFDLPPELLAGFERAEGVKLQIVKGGDAGEMLNKLILTRAKPIADVVYGIDNTLVPRAAAADVIEPYSGPAAQRLARAVMGETAAGHGVVAGVVPVDYGYVTLNVDKAWFARSGMALPTVLEELADPVYAKLLVVQNPATSSPGQAFLLANIAAMGEETAFAWWARLRVHGVKVVKGWTEAYYTEFTHNGGTRPIVVSYASSPAAEVFYAKTPPTEAPTANLFLKGGVFRQVEGVALVKGGRPEARAAAGRFIEFLRSQPVQQALQTTMWMYPAELGVPHAEVLRRHAAEPPGFDTPTAAAMERQGRAWVQRWTRTMTR